MHREPEVHPHTLRVLIASNFYPPYVVGGAELVAYNLATWLAAAGVDVSVVSTCAPGVGRNEEIIDGVRIFRYFPENLWWNFERFASGDRRNAGSKLLWNIRDAWNPDSARMFGQILDEVRPNILHTHNIKGFSPAIWHEATRRSIPFVHTTHDYHLACQRGTMLRSDATTCGRRCAQCVVWSHWVAKLACQAQLICSPSQFVLARHQTYGISGRRGGTVVPNGVPSVSAEFVRRSPSRQLRLLFLGQLRREKGIHLLPNALAAFGSNVHLSIAGDGDLNSLVTDWTARDRRISFHGFLRAQAKERLLANSDVLVFPSIWTENAPLVIAEAMMRGLPVVASDLGAIPEFVSHEKDGLLFPAGDSTALAGQIQRLLREPGLLSRLSVGALRSAENWTIPTMGNRYLEIYQSIHSRERLVPRGLTA